MVDGARIRKKAKSDEVVHHINENKLDNAISNLEVLSKSEHARLHAKPPYFSEEARKRAIEANIGRPAVNRKLSEEDVAYIREHYIPRDKNYGSRAPGRLYRVGHKTILQIINGSAYKSF